MGDCSKIRRDARLPPASAGDFTETVDRIFQRIGRPAPWVDASFVRVEGVLARVGRPIARVDEIIGWVGEFSGVPVGHQSGSVKQRRDTQHRHFMSILRPVHLLLRYVQSLPGFQVLRIINLFLVCVEDLSPARRGLVELPRNGSQRVTLLNHVSPHARFLFLGF